MPQLLCPVMEVTREEHGSELGGPGLRLRAAGRLAAVALVVVLTLAPMTSVTWIVATNGADNPSNDLLLTIPLVDKVLAGTYDWRNLCGDCFLDGAHFMLLPLLIRILIAYSFHWNIYVECYTAILLAGLKLVLLHGALTRGSGRWQRLILWPILSALVFSLSQIDVFTFGDSGLTIQMTQLGLALGLWGLAHFPRRLTGVVLAGMGGVMACYSGGGGPFVWPAFLVCMWLLGERRWGHYLTWLGAAGVGCLPYFALRLLYPHPAKEAIGLWFSLPGYVRALGWPFCRYWDIRQARAAGLCGIGLGASALWLCWRWRQRLSRPRLAPAFALFVYAAIAIWMTVKFRGPVYAPWYTSSFMMYWIGLVGLVYGLGVSEQSFGQSRNSGKLATLFGCASLAILTFWFLRTNLTFQDKAFYLQARAPVSASALRHYRTAPTYAEQYVFQWGVGNCQFLRELAEPLERHGVSVFAPHQRWTLQGDFPLDTVRLSEKPGIPEVAWWDGMDGTLRPFATYRHLNLFLHPPNAVHWQVTLPRSLQDAVFCSAVALSPTVPVNATADGALCQLHLEDQSGRQHLLWAQRLNPGDCTWIPCNVSLRAFAGQTVTLHLSADPLSNFVLDWILWRHPYIDVNLLEPEPQPEVQVRPCNTDLSPSQPVPSRSDLELGILDANRWELHDVTPAPESPGTWRAGHAPYLRYKPPLNLLLSDYSHVYVRAALAEGISPRYLQIGLTFDKPVCTYEVLIPLLRDGGQHLYTYDLKLLRGLQSSHLVGVRLDLFRGIGEPQGGQISVIGLGLIRNAFKHLN